MNRENILSKTTSYLALQKVFIDFCSLLKKNPSLSSDYGLQVTDEIFFNSQNILVLGNFVTLKFEYHNYNDGIIGKIDIRSGEGIMHIIGTIYFDKLGNWKKNIDASNFQYNFARHDDFFVFILGCFFDKYYLE